ncbi:MAG: hypothetical protein ACYC96_12160 [Fimbriimonadaceae bacterium]
MVAQILLIAALGQTPALPVPPNWALLLHPSVQSALELTAPQTRAIFAIRSAGMEIFRRLSRRHPKKPLTRSGLPGLASLPALEKFGRALPRAKQARLAQITLQSYGPHVLKAPGITKALGLSPTEAKRIAKAQAVAAVPYNNEIRTYAVSHHLATRLVDGVVVLPVDTPETHAIQVERDAKLSATLRAGLSAAQNARLIRLLGKPVKLN